MQIQKKREGGRERARGVEGGKVAVGVILLNLQSAKMRQENGCVTQWWKWARCGLGHIQGKCMFEAPGRVEPSSSDTLTVECRSEREGAAGGFQRGARQQFSAGLPRDLGRGGGTLAKKKKKASRVSRGIQEQALLAVSLAHVLCNSRLLQASARLNISFTSLAIKVLKPQRSARTPKWQPASPQMEAAPPCMSTRPV